MIRLWNRLLVGIVLLLATGCGLMATPTPTPEPTATVRPTSTPSRTPTPRPTATPTVTPTPGPLSAAEVFDLVSPSVAYVQTETRSGSGVLLEGGYLLTNAHVVWPYRAARVVFSDGSEFLDAPVHDWDLLADLALIGPLETELPYLALEDKEDRVIGSDVYLVGYPGEVERFPQPTFGRGLISRVREWERLGLTYFQTDAAITGGQSGGILVADRGEVIGLSGLRFTDVSYGLVLSAADILPRLDALRAPDRAGPARLASGAGETAPRFRIQPGETELFVVHLTRGQDLDLTIRGRDDVTLTVLDPDGYWLMESEEKGDGSQSGRAKAEVAGPHMVIVEVLPGGRGGFVTLTSNRPLLPHEDDDDQRLLPVGRTYEGVLDYAGDIDRYELVLQAGDMINVQVDSMMFDPIIELGSRYARRATQFASDDNSGDGLFGLAAELSFFASESGLYDLTVWDAYGFGMGGYVVTVKTWVRGEPTPYVPPAGRVTDPESEEPGRYVSDYYPFAMNYPPDWIDDGGQFMSLLCAAPDADACLISPDNEGVLLIRVEELSGYGLRTLSPQDYADLMEEFLNGLESFTNVTRREARTTSGLQVYLFEGDVGGLYHFVRLMYIGDGLAFNAVYMILKDSFPAWEPVIAESLASFELLDE